MPVGTETAKPVVFEIPEDQLGSPHAYVRAAARVQNMAGRGEITAVDLQRYTDILEKNCLRFTGRSLADVAQDKVDALERFQGNLANSKPLLMAVIDSIRQLDDDRMSAEQKKKAISTLASMIALIDECRDDPSKAAIYIGSDSTTGKVLRLMPYHDEFCRTWNDPATPNSLIEAPPGHGKSTLMYLFMAWKIGDKPHLRHLYVTDSSEKAERAIGVVRRHIQSARYHALFPEVFVLSRIHGRKSDATQFSVNGLLDPSREATLTASGVLGNINGDGFDRIWGDDFCSPLVAEVESVRIRTNDKWFKVIVKRLRDHRDAGIHIIHTPWHNADTCGIILRDIQDGRRGNWQAVLKPILDDDRGRAIPIWPDRFPAKFLEGEKRMPGYDPLYRLQTASGHDILVRSVHYYHADTASPKSRECDLELAKKLSTCERWLSVDPAATSGQKSSFTGVVEFALSGQGYVFVTNCWFLRLTPIGLQAWLLEQLFNATGAGYTGIHLESQAAMKYGNNLMEHNIREGLRTGVIPKEDKTTGQWGTYKYPKPYGRHLQLVNTDTRFGIASNQLSKRHRLKMASATIASPVVRFAGELKENRNMPRNHARRWYYGPVDGSHIATLTSQIINFDNQAVTDGVDALTQWLIVNVGRLASQPMQQAETQQVEVEVKTINERAQEQMMAKAKPEADQIYDEDFVLDGGLGDETWN